MIEPAGLIACRFVHISAVLILFGAALYPVYSRDPAAPWRKGLAALTIVAVISGLGWFALTAAAMSGVSVNALDRATLMAVLTQTDFGPLWVVRMAVLAVMAGFCLRGLAMRLSRTSFQVLSAVALTSLAGTGHARMTDGWLGAIHVLGDGIHLLAAGAWLGGLVVLGREVVRWSGALPDESGSDAFVRLERFSAMGMAAVALLVVSGIVNSWLMLGSMAAIWSSPYGQFLAVKVALFLGMSVLAAINRFQLTPRFAGDTNASRETLRTLRRHVIAEQLLGVAVVAVVSLIGTLQTPV